MANVIEIAWELGYRSILSWGCTTQFPVFLWLMLAMIVHGMIFLAAGLRKRSPPAGSTDLDQRPQPGAGHVIALQMVNATKPDDTAGLLPSRMPLARVVTALNRGTFSRWPNEFRPCVLHTQCRCLDETSQSGFWKTGFNLLAGAFSNVHFIVVVVIFSTLQFMSVWEVCNKVLWRLVASSAACRIVMMIEVTTIRKHTIQQQF